MKKFRQLLSAILCATVTVPLIACSSHTPKPSEYLQPHSWKEGNTILTGTSYTPSYTRDDIPNAIAHASITADKTVGNLCTTGTSFTVKPAGNTTSADILNYITSTPQIDFSCTESEDGTYTLTPNDDLEPNTVYRLSVGGDNPISSFAFQTESVFALESAFPADLATNVPIDSGIELRFTEAISTPLDEIENYISVSPAVEGEFLLYPDRKTVVFAPTNKLNTGTVYSVSISSGITGEERELGEDICVKFRTSAKEIDENDVYLNFNLISSMPIFAPGDAMYLSYRVDYYGNNSNNPAHGDARVKIYRYDSADDAVEAMKDYLSKATEYAYTGKEYSYQTKGLTEVYDSTATPTSQNSRFYGAQYLDLPTLDRGVYLVCVTPSATLGNTEFSNDLQALVQVSDYAVYTESSADTLVWVNSVSGEKTAGLDIKADLFFASYGWDTEYSDLTYTTVHTTTDFDGIAILDTSVMPEANRAFILVDGSLIICADSINYNTAPQKYAAWVYTDRKTYFSTDTVNFSGVLSAVDGTSLPEYIYLSTPVSSAKQKIKVNSDGSFIGSFSYEDWSALYNSTIWMSFTDESGVSVESTFVRVTANDKPVYTASLSFDRLFYEFGDSGTATLSASFFDGTPAPGLTFSVYIYPFGKQTTVTTDENGTAEINFTCVKHSFGSTDPSSIRISAYLTGYEDTSLSISSSVVYFQSKNHLRIDRDDDGEGVTVRLNAFDTSVIKSAEDLSWRVFPENCIGEAAEGTISVTLKKVTYVKTETGSQYNPITKKTEKTYSYRTVESNVSSDTYTFENGEIHLPCLDREYNCSYYYVITYRDTQNSCDIRRTVGAVKYSSNYYYNYNEYYSLESTLSSDTRLISGESVEFELKYGGSTVTDKKVIHSIYTGTGDGRLSTEISSGGFSVEYTNEYIFGVRIVSAVFDGKNIVELWANAPSYDYERGNQLDITLEASGESFKPGDNCTVTVKATGADGDAAAGAVITVGIVDEACFKLGEQTLNPLEGYFGLSPYYPSTNDRFSCFSIYSLYDKYALADDMKAEVSTESAGEAPAENESANEYDSVTLREYFADNPVFTSVTLDKNGEASLSFTVPDNITEWRITAAGYTLSDDIFGTQLGHTTTDVIATLPFFVSASLSDTYASGDDISATARIFGSGITLGDEVSYLAELSDYDGNVIRNLEADGTIGEQIHFNLGKLDAGSYYLSVKAISGENSDGVRLPLTVVPDGITVATRRTLTADDIPSLAPALYPVNISFTNAQFADYLDVVYHVYSTRYNRADSLAARYAAVAAIDKIYGGGLDSKELERISDTLSSYSHRGLIPLMQYAEGDVILTAKIAALTPELIPSSRRAEIIEAFSDMIRKQSYKNDAQLAACLLGLAALGEPVLSDIHTVASSDISLEAKLYLSFALAIIGDYSAARELYDISLSERFEGDDELCVSAETTEEKIKLTALALMTASYVDSERATPMAKYILSHTSSLDVYSLELVAYINNFYPIGATEAKFTYATDGEEAVEVVLKPGEVFTLTLGKSALESLSVESTDDVLILASYLGGISDALDSAGVDNSAKITKTIEPHDLTRGIYKVKISYEITFDSNYECYTLSDRIPSGARYYGAYEKKANTSQTDSYSFAYLRNDGDQMMHGYIGMYNPTEKYIDGRDSRTVTGEITYLIRAAVSGEFTVSSAILQNTDSGKYALSESGRIVIGEAKNERWTVELVK